MIAKFGFYLSVAFLLGYFQDRQRQVISISGTVVRADSQVPIANATITVTTPALTIKTTTSKVGVFAFELESGTYTLVASGEGYRPAKLGVGSQTVIVQAEGISPIIQLRLTPESTIRGSVVSSAGEARRGIPVSVFMHGYLWGRLVLTHVARTETDAAGLYRFPGLDPGKYFVRTEPHVDGSTHGTTYFPGTLDVVSAEEILVTPGSDVVLPKFQIQPAPMYTISGKVIFNAQGALPSTSLYVIPVYREPVEEYPTPQINAAVAVSGGIFEIGSLQPGTYHLFAVAETGTTVDCLVGGVRLELARDTDRIEVPLQPCSKVEIHAGLVGNPGPQFTGVTTVTLVPQLTLPIPLQTLMASQSSLPVFVGISSRNFPPFPRPNVPPPAPGVVTFPQIPVGTYTLLTTSLPHSYLLDIRRDERSFLKEELRMPFDAPGPVELLLAIPGQVIKGTVVDPQGRPVPNQPVVLIPDAPYRKTFMWYKVVNSDSQGNFIIDSVARWTYKLFASTDIEASPLEASPFLNTRFLQQYEDAGRPVDVRSRSQDGVVVTVITNRIDMQRH